MPQTRRCRGAVAAPAKAQPSSWARRPARPAAAGTADRPGPLRPGSGAAFPDDHDLGRHIALNLPDISGKSGQAGAESRPKTRACCLHGAIGGRVTGVPARRCPVSRGSWRAAVRRQPGLGKSPAACSFFAPRPKHSRTLLLAILVLKSIDLLCEFSTCTVGTTRHDKISTRHEHRGHDDSADARPAASKRRTCRVSDSATDE